MHSARHLKLIDICIKFREYSLSGFKVIEQTRFVTDRQTDRRPGKNNMSPDPEGGRHNNHFELRTYSFCFLNRLSIYNQILLHPLHFVAVLVV